MAPIAVVNRTTWGAAPQRAGMATQPPPREAFLHMTDNPGGGRVTSLAAQSVAVRSVQAFHQGPQRGWADIGYHYLILGTTAATCRPFAGRRIDQVPAAQLGHNTGTLSIAFYCGPEDEVTPRMRYVAEDLLRRIPSLRTLGVHRQVSQTDCPGDRVAAAARVIARATRLELYAGGRNL